MILGVGIDIVEVSRIKDSYEKFGEAFLKRLLLPAEIAYCLAYRQPVPYIAVRFSAKEAISKAFGTGIGSKLGWHDMEIARKESGEPHVILHGAGLKLLAERGAGKVLLSMSHTQNYATAVALLDSE